MRYASLDTIRGFAVMGILLMNIIAFSMPEAGYLSPAAYGGMTGPDVMTWAIMFVAVDSKMRGLFSMLFGASMLLVYERAEASNGNGRAVHVRRMIWLLLFGAIHFYLIWFGDILMLYAMCGLIGLFLLKLDEASLRRAAIWLLGTSMMLLTLASAALLTFRFKALQPGADATVVSKYQDLASDIGGTASKIADEIALHRGSWFDLVEHRLANDLFDPLTTLALSGLETLGLMALGMMLFRNGFLTGGWSDDAYMRTMKRAYVLGVPPLVLLALWNWSTGFDPIINISIFFAFSAPFRLAVMVGHAALIMVVIKRFAGSGFIARVEAAGKAAFTNYLGTSILMTGLFYGWGLGLFGYLSRWQVYLVVPFVWAIMLVWSKPWLDHYRYGPLEWLWRTLARGSLQPMRR